MDILVEKEKHSKEIINVEMQPNRQQLLQRIWAIGLMGSWFCIWQFSDNRKINLNLEPKPAVVPERWWQFYSQDGEKRIKTQ